MLELRARSRTGQAIRALLGLAPHPVFGPLLSPIVASAAMTFSFVSVIGNALRLRRIPL